MKDDMAPCCFGTSGEFNKITELSISEDNAKKEGMLQYVLCLYNTEGYIFC